jgi:2-polyprenyl-3-methyl-5-hydroxy-6-metoxy-1,4-benzoquinol methylase
MNEYTQKSFCNACGSNDLIKSLDLRNQPLANSYKKSIAEEEKKYPLAVNLCKNCFHLQLTHSVNQELIFKSYLYVSGTSKTLKEYSDWFAKFVDEYIDKKFNCVLDIGCNDGLQLNSFKELGYTTWGIDPAENIYPISSKNHNIICDFLNEELTRKNTIQFDAISAQNVVAHNPDPYQFLLDVKNLMSDHTLLFVQTSQANMVSNNEFDTIYHEHNNFFNAMSMKKLAERCGLNVIDCIKTPIHGVSYVFVLSKTINQFSKIDNFLNMEEAQGLYNTTKYFEWENKVETNMAVLKKTLLDYKSKDYKLVGYGAAAKGNTLLNYIDAKLDLIIDDNPLKQNLFTPGTNIPIKVINELTNFVDSEKIMFIPLAWNFFNEIKNRILTVRNNKNDCFLTYFPKVEIINV